MKTKICVDDLVIELTRQCNMFCDHCLRGDQENIDQNPSNIKKLFKQLKNGYISSITFTGGEPSLKPNLIKKTIQLAKKYKIEFGSFYIATNGKQVSNEFLLAVMELYLFCSDNEGSVLEYTIDDYHDEIDEENKRRLEILKFCHSRSTSDYKHLIMEGKAKENYSDTGQYEKPGNYELEQNEFYFRIGENEIYLNCKGNLVSSCDLSYESQDKLEFIICSVNDDLISLIQKYQNNLNKQKEID